jgi:DNA-binding LacI/PurR family transcriptional regulator
VDFSASLEPALSTVRIDGAELGRIAAQFIVERAEGTRVRGARGRHRLRNRGARQHLSAS